jgi:menaquinone-dependent protoporphyrinogen oxidase
MENRVLVAYSSKHGATAEIAEKIGEVLRQAGLQVEIAPVKNVKDPKSYDAFVLGTAAYMFRWRSDLVSFLKKRQDVLVEKPTWLFSSGPLGKGDPVELLKGQRFPRSLQLTIESIRPRDVAVFHGFVNMQKLNFFESFVFKKRPDMQGDYRDWEAINSWAKSIAVALRNKDE